MLAYKFLRPGAVGPFSGFVWPAGEWVTAGDAPAPCRTGIHACQLPQPTTIYSDAQLLHVYRETRTVAMVGASPNWNRPSYFVMRYLQVKGFRVIPVNPRAPATTVGRPRWGSSGAGRSTGWRASSACPSAPPDPRARVRRERPRRRRSTASRERA